MADWLANGGINATDPRVKTLCDAAYSALNEIPPGTAIGKFTPLLDASGAQVGIAHPASAFTVRDEPHPAMIILLALLWLAAWAFGMRFIFRRPVG